MAFLEKLKAIFAAPEVKTEEKKEEKNNDDVRQVFLKTAAQFQEGLQLGRSFVISNASEMQHLTFVGMGGSLNPAFLLKTYLENTNCAKQINLVRDYKIPVFVSNNGFFFVISYSGNTEETLAAYQQAFRQGYPMLVMTSGGILKELAEKNRTPLLILPSGYHPRHSVYLMLGALLQILQNSGVIEKGEKQKLALQQIIESLQKPIFEEMGKQLAETVKGKVPIIYTTPKLGEVGLRWKICFNENAKVHAFCNQLPELNHNEINAYAAMQENWKEGFHVLFLVDQEETKEHKKRIAVTKQIIKEQGYPATEVVIKGASYLARLLSAVHIGDWVSYYCAMELGVDPGKVEIIERLKKLLKE